MPRIFIRVELHGLTSATSYATYERLHAFMLEKNWSRSVDGKLADGSKVSRNLPTATYSGITSTGALAVAEALSNQIAAAVWRRNTVLVMNSAESWAIAGEQIQ